MPTNVKQMIEVANAAVPRITPAQAKEMMAKGKTLVVDVRDASHLHAAAAPIEQMRDVCCTATRQPRVQSGASAC